MARLFGNAIGKQGQRSLNRLKLGLPAVLMLAHGRVACILEDISASGARVRTDGTISQGQSAELQFDRHRMFATVSWTRGGVAGLRFADQLDTSEMKRLLWIVENREQWESQRAVNGARAWAANS
jgi:hypothetical protein